MCLASQVLSANAHLLLEQNLLNPGIVQWKYITFSQNILVSEEHHIHLFGQPAGASSLWIEHLLPAEVLLQHGNTKTRTAKQCFINTLAKAKSNKKQLYKHAYTCKVTCCVVSILTRPSSKLTKLWARSLQRISLSWLQWGGDRGTLSSSSPKGSWKVPNKKIRTTLYYTL